MNKKPNEQQPLHITDTDLEVMEATNHATYQTIVDAHRLR